MFTSGPLAYKSAISVVVIISSYALKSVKYPSMFGHITKSVKPVLTAFPADASCTPSTYICKMLPIVLNMSTRWCHVFADTTPSDVASAAMLNNSNCNLPAVEIVK